MQELLVEGPLTNLKPSMIALSQPKRKFDRAAFGVGGVGAGAMGAIGRYHPPEKVGDPIPGANVSGGGSGSAGTTGTATGAKGAAAGVNNSHANGFPAAAANGAAIGSAMGTGSFFGSTLGFSPFAGPSYAIPALPGADGRAGKGGSKAAVGASSRSLSSQLGPATQPDGGGLDASQGLGLGGFGSLGSMLTQASGGFSQFGGSSVALGGGGLGLGALGDAPLSQASFGYGGGAEDFGGVGSTDGFLTQAAGFSQSGFGDLLGASNGDASALQQQQQQQRNRLGS